MKKQGQKPIQTVALMAVGTAVGICIGVLLLDYLDLNESFGMFMAKYLLLVIALLIPYFLQLIIHEGGHLVFGLLSGYRFLSFRIGNVLLKKENGRLVLKKFSLAGTAGQCLLAPPDYNNGKYPYTLYNLGGVLMNLFTALLFLLLGILQPEGSLVRLFFLELALFGTVTALTNGIPLRTAMVANDGMNLLSCRKDPLSAKCFWLQLKINELQQEGVRLGEMPAEWFELPQPEGKESQLTGAIRVFAENRLMDAHDFDGARRALTELLAEGNDLPGLLRSTCALDLVFLDVLEKGKNAELSALKNKEIRSFLGAMKANPSVLRIQYAIALLTEQNETKAEQYKAAFEKAAAKYPIKADVDAERELMAVIAQKAAGRNEQKA